MGGIWGIYTARVGSDHHRLRPAPGRARPADLRRSRQV